MVAGLAISVLGNRLVEGGVDGFAAMSTIPVLAVVWLTAVDKVIDFALPLYARLLQRYPPDLALLAEDGVEVVGSLIAAGLIAVRPAWAVPVLLGYLVLSSLTLPVVDIADEFYGAVVAQEDPDQALDLNASLHAWMGGVAMVASPLGALLAGVSVTALLMGNVALTLGGMAFRLRARRTFPMRAVVDEDPAEFASTGERMPWRQFAHDLLRSGPSSPLLAVVLAFTGCLSGHLVIIWGARSSGIDPSRAMTVLLLAFGIAGVIGPLAARPATRWLGPTKVLPCAALASAANVAGLALAIWAVGPSLLLAGTFVLLNVTLGRLRNVALETTRQHVFRGQQYARVMSWSYTGAALGTVLGMPVAYALGVQDDPRTGLVLATLLWLAVAAVMTSRTRPAAAETGG